MLSSTKQLILYLLLLKVSKYNKRHLKIEKWALAVAGRMIIVNNNEFFIVKVKNANNFYKSNQVKCDDFITKTFE